MSNPVITVIGSGLGSFKNAHLNKRNLPSDAVAVMNFEDQSYSIAASGQTVAISATVATLIPSIPLEGRREIRLYNAGAATVFISSSSGSASGGYPLLAGTKETFPINGLINLWGVGSGVASSIRVLEFA